MMAAAAAIAIAIAVAGLDIIAPTVGLLLHQRLEATGSGGEFLFSRNSCFPQPHVDRNVFRPLPIVQPLLERRRLAAVSAADLSSAGITRPAVPERAVKPPARPSSHL
jgi:hypothetical protein